MKIAYDKTVDALNVTLRAGRVAKMVEVAAEVMLGGFTHTPLAADGVCSP
ncbi:MAG: hypothetical protein UY50_C0024G0029 [Parcubacteria group bacterium GW2011_GWA2_49_9]|nr:MAG: hypothetical protein UY50_C0024G0029 [Parcubacteria group bacterium GW2011_GWA2_49_9]